MSPQRAGAWALLALRQVLTKSAEGAGVKSQEIDSLSSQPPSSFVTWILPLFSLNLSFFVR